MMWTEMMGYMGSQGWGHMLFGGLMMVLFWAVIIALAVLLVRALSRGRNGSFSGRRPTPLELLQERYAKGEIDRDEYEQRKHDLMH